MADVEYNKKMEDLQQYLPFLTKMVTQLKAKSDSDDKKKEQQLGKIEYLHSIIADKKKLKLDTLTKCEEVIRNLHDKAKNKAQTQLSAKPENAIRRTPSSERNKPESASTVVNDSVKSEKKPITAPSPDRSSGHRDFYYNKRYDQKPWSPNPIKFKIRSNDSFFGRLARRHLYQTNPFSFEEEVTDLRQKLQKNHMKSEEDTEEFQNMEIVREFTPEDGGGQDEEEPHDEMEQDQKSVIVDTSKKIQSDEKTCMGSKESSCEKLNELDKEKRRSIDDKSRNRDENRKDKQHSRDRDSKYSDIEKSSDGRSNESKRDSKHECSKSQRRSRERSREQDKPNYDGKDDRSSNDDRSIAIKKEKERNRERSRDSDNVKTDKPKRFHKPDSKKRSESPSHHHPRTHRRISGTRSASPDTIKKEKVRNRQRSRDSDKVKTDNRRTRAVSSDDKPKDFHKPDSKKSRDLPRTCRQTPSTRSTSSDEGTGNYKRRPRSASGDRSSDDWKTSTKQQYRRKVQRRSRSTGPDKVSGNRRPRSINSDRSSNEKKSLALQPYRSKDQRRSRSVDPERVNYNRRRPRSTSSDRSSVERKTFARQVYGSKDRRRSRSVDPDKINRKLRSPSIEKSKEKGYRYQRRSRERELMVKRRSRSRSRSSDKINYERNRKYREFKAKQRDLSSSDDDRRRYRGKKSNRFDRARSSSSSDYDRRYVRRTKYEYKDERRRRDYSESSGDDRRYYKDKRRPEIGKRGPAVGRRKYEPHINIRYEHSINRTEYSYGVNVQKLRLDKIVSPSMVIKESGERNIIREVCRNVSKGVITDNVNIKSVVTPNEVNNKPLPGTSNNALKCETSTGKLSVTVTAQDTRLSPVLTDVSSCYSPQSMDLSPVSSNNGEIEVFNSNTALPIPFPVLPSDHSKPTDKSINKSLDKAIKQKSQDYKSNLIQVFPPLPTCSKNEIFPPLPSCSKDEVLPPLPPLPPPLPNEMQQLDHYPLENSSVPNIHKHEGPPVLTPENQSTEDKSDVKVNSEISSSNVSSKQRKEQSKELRSRSPSEDRNAISSTSEDKKDKESANNSELDVRSKTRISEPSVKQLSRTKQDASAGSELDPMDIINKFLNKLLENDSTRDAVSSFIKNVSSSLDDNKLKSVVHSITTSPKKSSVNRERYLTSSDEEDEVVTKRARKRIRKITKISTDEEEEEERKRVVKSAGRKVKLTTDDESQEEKERTSSKIRSKKKPPKLSTSDEEERTSSKIRLKKKHSKPSTSDEDDKISSKIRFKKKPSKSYTSDDEEEEVLRRTKIKKPRKVITDDESEKETKTKKPRKVITDDESEDSPYEKKSKKKWKKVSDSEDEEIVSKKMNSKSQKKSELDILHEDLRGMFIREGELTSTGQRMCTILKQDAYKWPRQRAPRNQSIKFDMKAPENRKELKKLRSLCVIIPPHENIDRMMKRDRKKSEASRKRRVRERSRSSSDESSSGKDCKKGSLVSRKRRVGERNRSSSDESSSEKDRKKYNLVSRKRRVGKRTRSSSDESSSEKDPKKYSLRHPHKSGISYVEAESEDERSRRKKSDPKKAEGYSLRPSNKKPPKVYLEDDSEEERIIAKIMRLVEAETFKPVEAETFKPVESETEKVLKQTTKSEKDSTEPTKSTINQHVKESDKPDNKIIHRKKVSNWANGIIPKQKKKKPVSAVAPRNETVSAAAPRNETVPAAAAAPRNETVSAVAPRKETVSTGAPRNDNSLEFIEPDKNYYSASSQRTKSRCKVCSFNGTHITQHYRLLHPEYEVLSSRLMQYKATQAIKESIKLKLDEVEEHELAPQNRYDFKCRFCDLFLHTTPAGFYNHVSTHTGEYRYVCTLCNYGAPKSDTLRKHYKGYHTMSEYNCIVDPVKTKVYGYLCLECNYVQIRKKALESHVNIYHLGEGRKTIKIYLSSLDHLIRNTTKERKVEEKSQSANKLDESSESQPPVLEMQSPVKTNKAAPKRKTSRVGDSPKAPVLEKQIKSPYIRKKPGPKCKTLFSEEPSAKRQKLSDPIPPVTTTTEIEKRKVTEERAKTKSPELEIQAPAKDVDMAVFTCDAQIEDREVQLAQERLETLVESGESVRTKSSSIIDRLSHKLLSADLYVPEPQDIKVESDNEDDLNNIDLTAIEDMCFSEGELDELRKGIEGLEDHAPLIEENREGELEELQTSIQDLEQALPVETDKEVDMAALTCTTDVEEEVAQDCIEKPGIGLVRPMSDRTTDVEEELLQNHIDKPGDDLGRSSLSSGDPLSDRPSRDKDASKDDSLVLITDSVDTEESVQSLTYTCKVPTCTFRCNDRNSFVTHMDKDHIDVIDVAKFVHVEETNTSHGQPVESSKTGTKLNAGYLEIIRNSKDVEYVCKISACNFMSQERNKFLNHWKEYHQKVNKGSTKCLLCGTQVYKCGTKTLLITFFNHVEEKHLDKVEENSFTFKISEVLSLADDNDDDVRVVEDDKEKSPFVIENVVSLAEQPVKEFVNTDVMSLVENAPPTSWVSNLRKWKSAAATAALMELPDKLYKCPQYSCSVTSDDRFTFDSHLNYHSKTKDEFVCCVYCDIKMGITQAGSHIDQYHSNCLYSCSKCFYRALKVEYVITHMRSKHNSSNIIIALTPQSSLPKSKLFCYSVKDACPPYKCGSKDCHQEFFYQREYIDHKNAHDGIMECGHKVNDTRCPYKCVFANNMIEHWRTHNCYSFHCLICKVGTMDLSVMVEHYSSTHPNREPLVVDRRNSLRGLPYGYTEEAFVKAVLIKDDLLSDISYKGYKIVRSDERLPSEIIEIDDKEEQSQEGMIMEDDTECYSEEMLIEKYGKLCDPDEKNLKCPICLYFKTKKVSYFIYHILQEIKCYTIQCDLCDYRCITSDAIAIHCQTKHNTDTSQVISVPTEKAVVYWLHLLISSQAKTITSNFILEIGKELQSFSDNTRCNYCERWFSGVDMLIEHKLYHWAQISYSCSYCSSKETTLNGMFNHFKNVHPNCKYLVKVNGPSLAEAMSEWKIPSPGEEVLNLLKV